MTRKEESFVWIGTCWIGHMVANSVQGWTKSLAKTSVRHSV
jgi:hypothetical protein